MEQCARDHSLWDHFLMESSQNQPSKKLYLIVIVAIIFIAVALTAYIFLFRQPATDLSGVWKDPQTNIVYIFDKQEDDYRLTVASHRLAVEQVDQTHQQISLTVRTESGLRAVWTFMPHAEENQEHPSLQFDQDGLANASLVWQRALTATDKTRISRLKAAKKPLWSPSFNCAKAATDVERMICTSPEIASLDVKLSKALKTATPDAKAEQKQWLSTVRDTCTDMPCVQDAYQTRLDTLAAASMAATTEDNEGDDESAEAETPKT